MSSEPRPPWTLRLTSRQLWVLDASAAATYLVLGWTVLADGGGAWLDPVAAALVSAPLVLHRRRLLVAFALLLLACVLTPAVDGLGFLALPPLAFVLGRVAATRAMRVAVLALALALAAVVATALPDFTHRGALLPFGLLLVTAWTVGRALGQQRSYAVALSEHRLARAQADADAARRAVADERLQIARELHDVVAHSMSVVTVQAAFGSLVFHERPDDARAALGAVEASGRQAMAEMRELLGVLRDPTGDRSAAGTPLLSPVETLADLDRLVAQTAKAGVRAELAVAGQARPLPAGVELCAYRIVQEALTNVIKHARTDTALVAIGYADDTLSIVVTDDGLGGRPDPGAGHGLVGIRERVALYGGFLQAGPLPERGYQVAVTLPLADAMA